MLDYLTRYPGQFDDTDPNYPQGKARNRSTPGAGDGSPWEADLANDIVGFFQALVLDAAITPSGNAESATTSDLLAAIKAPVTALQARAAALEMYSRVVVSGGPIDVATPFTLAMDVQNGGFTIASGGLQVPAAGVYEVTIFLRIDTPGTEPWFAGFQAKVGGSNQFNMGGQTSLDGFHVYVQASEIITVTTPASQRITIEPLVNDSTINTGRMLVKRLK